MTRSRAASLVLSAALHAVGGFAISRPAAVKPSSRVSDRPGISVFVAPTPDALETGLNPLAQSRADIFIPRAESSTLRFPDFTSDFGKVRSNASLLFPFLTPGLASDLFRAVSRDDDRTLGYTLEN